MAKIYLDATNAEYNITNNNDDVIGLVGTQSVALASGVTGVQVDQNVEEVVFAGAASDYTFLQSGNSIKVYANDTLVSTVFVQGDADGTQLSFSNGTAAAILAGGVLKLGGATVDAAVATHLNPTLDTTNIPPAANSGLNLTVGQDALVGSAGDDTFTADIFDNQNTLQSGDRINGGAGTDTLDAEIGNSQNFAMLAKTTSVENMFFQAQATATDSADNFNTDPQLSPLGDNGYEFSYLGASHDGASQIDAQDLQGVRQLWSDNSRANLVIEDVRENSHTTTIGMRDTDPGNVNYEVYFDPQHITGPGNDAEGATLTIRLADVLDLGKGGDGLSNLPYDGFTLDIGGTAVKLDIDFSALTSYADFKTAIEAALAAKGITSITVEQSPAETAVFSITVTDAGTTYLQGTVGGVYSPIVLTNSGAENLSLTSYTLEPGSQEPSGNLVRTASNNEASEIPSLTQVDVILDNVARGDASGSGDLVIGDMSESGIQQFNVQVDRSSHIDQLASTNNVLEVVNVENIDANGDLIINMINDVRVFDASTMIGDVSLGAYLSAGVTGKYLDLQDIQTDPAGDNSEIPYLNVVDTEFSYDLGTGDDTLDLAINSSNMAEAGTTTREDFVLEIQGGTGDDDITLAIVDVDIDGDLVLASDTTNWYDNSVLNANLSIDAGAGDDTISTPGAGNVVIEAGSGNDTVYADNTGANAVFVFNALNNDVDDLASDTNESYRFYKTTVTVNYLGFDVTVDLPNSSGVASDLQINQAIKNAINNDDVLNKLLVANDGPANTLVVTSLIDGAMITEDLTISLDTPNTLSAADVTLLNSYYGTPGGTEATHLAIFANELADFEGRGDYDTVIGAGLAGSISDYTSDNIITGDTGNDVIVLGTGTNSNDTVVYEGYDQTGNGLNDNDTIVNFDTTWIPEQSVLVPGATNVAEVVTLTFTDSDGTPAAQTIIFGGQTISLSAPAGQGVIPAEDVAYQFATQLNSANWEVTHVPNTNTVTLTSTVLGNVTDLVAGDFTGTYVEAAGTGGGGVITPVVATQGDFTYAATASTFTVDFDAAGTAAAAAGSFVFDTVTVNYLQGDGAITLAQAILAQSVAFAAAGWTVSLNALDPTAVDFVSTVLGAEPIALAADFDLGANTIVGTVSGTVGTAVSTTPVYVTTPAQAGPGLDYLDFSSYDVDSVYVNSDLIFDDVVGDGLLAANEDYVYMVESTTNDGEYTIYLMNTGSTAGFGGLTLDVEVGVIGVADFGVEQPFVAENFII